MISQLTFLFLTRRRYPGWRSRYAQIQRIQRLAPEAFHTWQARALARHLTWARARTPFHRQRIGRGDRLEEIPALTRADLQSRGDALRDPSRSISGLYRESSGGSTGHPVSLWLDDAHRAWDMATEVHVMRSWGVEPWARSAFVWGSDRDLADLGFRERLWTRLSDRRVLNAFRMSEEDLARYADELERFQPVYLQGYASALDLLASWLQANRPDHGIRPRIIRSSAEVLRADVRARLEEVFRTRVLDFYGSREVASIAAECLQGGLHVQGHMRIVEVVDDEGRPLPPSTPGRVLVTDLGNRAFGMIRYDTGDVAALAPDDVPCACGCPYPRLERVWGRSSDFISTPAGERIHGEWFTHLFYGRDDIRQFQVHQPALERLEVRTVGPASETDLADLLAAMRARMGERVEVVWERVEDIPLPPSGKHRFTSSDVPPTAGPTP